MRKLTVSLLLLSTLTLSGCATGCREACVFGFGPGSSAFEKVANHYDSQDPCQAREFGNDGSRLKPAGYSSKDFPSYCGASRGKTIRITKGIGNSYIVAP